MYENSWLFSDEEIYMSQDLSFSISIPSDKDGYILLQCEHCGSFFKITADDIKRDSLINLYCPTCGLISENYFTDAVIELAEAMAENYAMDMIYDAFKAMERSTKHSALQVKAGKKPEHKKENSIKSGVDELEIAELNCCRSTVKVKPILKMIGCYCPFCGVRNYETK